MHAPRGWGCGCVHVPCTCVRAKWTREVWIVWGACCLPRVSGAVWCVWRGWSFQAEAHTGCKLTDSLAMLPAASVSALVFAHPQSRYFALDKIAKDQVGTTPRAVRLSHALAVTRARASAASTAVVQPPPPPACYLARMCRSLVGACCERVCAVCVACVCLCVPVCAVCPLCMPCVACASGLSTWGGRSRTTQPAKACRWRRRRSGWPLPPATTCNSRCRKRPPSPPYTHTRRHAPFSRATARPPLALCQAPLPQSPVWAAHMHTLPPRAPHSPPVRGVLISMARARMSQRDRCRETPTRLSNVFTRRGRFIPSKWLVAIGRAPMSHWQPGFRRRKRHRFGPASCSHALAWH